MHSKALVQSLDYRGSGPPNQTNPEVYLKSSLKYKVKQKILHIPQGIQCRKGLFVCQW